MRDEIELPVGDHFIIIWLLGTNNRPIHVSNNYVKVTIQPPETPTTTPRVLRAPTPAAPVPLPSRMRINLMDAVKRERTLLKRISNSLKRIKEKIPIRGRREVEEAAVEAEEAAEELKEFEEKRILERISPALHEKSKRINRRVRAIVRFVKMKVKKEGFIKAAKILLKLEEDRVRALGTAEEGRPVPDRERLPDAQGPRRAGHRGSPGVPRRGGSDPGEPEGAAPHDPERASAEADGRARDP